MATLRQRAEEMVAANGGSITYAQAVRALKARNAKIKAKRESAEAAAQDEQAALDADLVKPSVLAKELGIHMSVLYGMIKRGTIRNHRSPHDQSSMVSRSEVERARAGGRKAKAAARAAGIPDAPPKSPLKKGQILLMRKTSLQRKGPEGAQTMVRVVRDIPTDSETGLAIALDSTGREMYYTADDVHTLLADGRLLDIDAPFLLDAIGKHMIEEGHDEYAQWLGEIAKQYQQFLTSLNSKPKNVCIFCGEPSNEEKGKLRRKKNSEDWMHAACLVAAPATKIRVRKISADMDEKAPARKMTAYERQVQRRNARKEADATWR